jgi:hypothetical protein
MVYYGHQINDNEAEGTYREINAKFLSENLEEDLEDLGTGGRITLM